MEHAHTLFKAAFDAAVKALSEFPTFYYDARTGRYHSAATRKMVSFEAIQAVFHAKETFDGERLTKIALAFKRGNLPLNLWYQATLDQLRKWHIQQAAFGAGGFGRLRPSDYERIEQLLAEDRPRLERFGRQIPTMGDGQIQYRLNLYLGNGRRNYWRAKRLPAQARKPGYTIVERRVIQSGDNCEWCIHLADFGWQPYGVLPYPGEIDQSWYGHACLTNCRCKLERRYIKVENMGKYVKRPFMVAAYDPVEHGKAYDPDQERWPSGTPGGLGGQFKPTDLESMVQQGQALVSDLLGRDVAVQVELVDPAQFSARYDEAASGVTGRTAAVYTEDDNVLRLPADSDGLDVIHELLHAGGFLPHGISESWNEGITQAFARRFGIMGFPVRDSYGRNADLAEQQLFPVIDDLPAFARGYAVAEDKAQFVADTVFDRYGDYFADAEEWGSNPKARFASSLRDWAGGSNLHLDYLNQFNPNNKAYEESEHPRDAQGRWTDKPDTVNVPPFPMKDSATPWGYINLRDAEWTRVRAEGITNDFFTVRSQDGRVYFAKRMPDYADARKRELTNYTLLKAWGFDPIPYGLADRGDQSGSVYYVFPHIGDTGFGGSSEFGTEQFANTVASIPIAERFGLFTADFIVGNPDRHSNNLLVNPDRPGEYMAIDNAFFIKNPPMNGMGRSSFHAMLLPSDAFSSSTQPLPSNFSAQVERMVETPLPPSATSVHKSFIQAGKAAALYAARHYKDTYAYRDALRRFKNQEELLDPKTDRSTIAMLLVKIAPNDEAVGDIETVLNIVYGKDKSAKAYEESEHPRLDQNDEFSSAVTYDTAHSLETVIQTVTPDKSFRPDQPRYPKGDSEGRGGQWRRDEAVPLIAREPITYSPPRPDFELEAQPDPAIFVNQIGAGIVAEPEAPLVIERPVPEIKFDRWFAKGNQEHGYPIGEVNLNHASWKRINSTSMTQEMYVATEKDGTMWFVKGFNADEQVTLDRELSNYTMLTQAGLPVLPFGVTVNPKHPGFRLMAFPHLDEFDLVPMSRLSTTRRNDMMRLMEPETPLLAVTFDFALGNWDRHAGNVMVGRDLSTWVLIDNAFVDDGPFYGLQRGAGRSAFITPFRTMPEQPEEHAPLPPALVGNIERMASMELPEAMRPDQRTFWGYGVAFARFAARRSHTQGAFVRMMRSYSKWEAMELSRESGLTPDSVTFLMQMLDHDENATVDMDWKRYEEGGELWDILQALDQLPPLQSPQELAPIDN